MSDVVELTAVPKRFERWLVGRPLAERSRGEYARNVRAYCAWLDQTPNGAGWQGDPLSDPLARDHAARDYRRYLQVERKAAATVNLALASLDALYRWLGLGRPNVRREKPAQAAPRALDEDAQRRLLRAAEAAADVEVIDGGERVVDGRGAGLQDSLEVGAVVAHRPVPATRERVLVEVGAGEPRQVLADFRGVGTAGLSGERSCRKSMDVIVEHGAELSPPAPPGRGRDDAAGGRSCSLKRIPVKPSGPTATHVCQLGFGRCLMGCRGSRRRGYDRVLGELVVELDAYATVLAGGVPDGVRRSGRRRGVPSLSAAAQPA
jgi:Phage integrase, N-terminal SAM-like domain